MRSDDMRDYEGVILGEMGRVERAKARAVDYLAAAEGMAVEWMEGGLFPASGDETTAVSVFVVDTDGSVRPCTVHVRVQVHAGTVDADVPVPPEVAAALGRGAPNPAPNA